MDDLLSFDEDDDLLSMPVEDNLLAIDEPSDLLSFGSEEDDLLAFDFAEEDYTLKADLQIPSTVEGILKEARLHKRQGRNPVRTTEEARPDWTAYEELVYWVEHFKKSGSAFVEEHCMHHTLMVMRHGGYKIPVKCNIKGHTNYTTEAEVTAVTLDGEKVEVMARLPFVLDKLSNTKSGFNYFRFTIFFKDSGPYIPSGVPFILGN